MASKQINNIPDKSYIDSIQSVGFSPIFIMGDHRFGTTLLYKTLVATECFNFVKAYHIIKYDEIIYNSVNKIENQDYVSIRYEDLCYKPETTILKILEFLELEQRVTLAYDKLIEPRTLKLLPEVQAKSERIRHKLQPYFDYHGYDI
ncbi:hypothetical protein [Limnofasciculus baicalensis]|uniref:Sulfotransferase domain-containing protein n=1 Tax=Limnofasciculus baicalensis BBK-W-15 TaxID=2699891 RepID=A0AAE3KLC6_9CYAN|nr:hypothetical protein [Limnofasciculus baicalensis]MCP2728400.1 hypothetical protein [Limnofasciculus baicalensis BBK-W-15]